MFCVVGTLMGLDGLLVHPCHLFCHGMRGCLVCKLVAVGTTVVMAASVNLL